MSIGLESIDQSNTLGQIIMLIAVSGVVGTQLYGLFSKSSGGTHKSKIELMRDRLEVEKNNNIVIRKVNRNLSEWQLVARALIQALKNEVVKNGGEISERIVSAEERLEAIDNREVDYIGDEPN